MAIITLKDLVVTFGNDVVLDHAELVIEAGERLCLTGRNGSGKSTMLKVIAAEVKPDGGQLWRQESLSFATLAQDLPFDPEQTVYEIVAGAFDKLGSCLAEYHQVAMNLDDPANVQRLSDLQEIIEAGDGWSINHKIESILQRMKLPADALMSSLSGGWLKRVAIAASLVLEPEVWLLDEPTNHLDIETIAWLENVMLDYPGTILFITHDRALMRNVANTIVEIDRGQVKKWECGYDEFIERRDHEREVEAEHNKKFDDKLKREEVWIRQGIKARRTRNEGRVRALEALRVERSKRINMKSLKMEVDTGSASGKVVKELIGVSKGFDDKQLITNFDFILSRKDRIGLIGRNGTGKSTLLKILLDELQPDSGEVKTGTKLQVAYFDQIRDQLEPEQSVNEYISEGREYITIGNKETHVVSYLQNFMFSPDQARAPIRTLSGGEQSRLLLAKLFSQPANLLVLDEPTNDLDIETLELLEELLLDFDGTVLMVSHDRIFMDNAVSSLLIFEGDGLITEFVGGYDDWIRSGGKFKGEQPKQSTAKPDPQAAKVEQPKVVAEDDGLSHGQRKQAKAKLRKLEKELERLPQKIEAAEAERDKQHAIMGEDSFFRKTEAEQHAVYGRVEVLDAEIETAMARWDELEALMN